MLRMKLIGLARAAKARDVSACARQSCAISDSPQHSTVAGRLSQPKKDTTISALEVPSFTRVQLLLLLHLCPPASPASVASPSAPTSAASSSSGVVSLSLIVAVVPYTLALPHCMNQSGVNVRGLLQA